LTTAFLWGGTAVSNQFAVDQLPPLMVGGIRFFLTSSPQPSAEHSVSTPFRARNFSRLLRKLTAGLFAQLRIERPIAPR
jgi:hypothetical protein